MGGTFGVAGLRERRRLVGTSSRSRSDRFSKDQQTLIPPGGCSCRRGRCHAFDHGLKGAFVVREFLIPVKRSYVQQSSPGHTGLKGG